MLAPIVTKEMKLFPSQPLPPRVKNVRSRAQSLQDFANGNAIHVTSSSSTAHHNTTTQQNGAILLNPNGSTATGGARGPIRSRNSQSIGSLPTNTVLATGYQNSTATTNPITLIPSAKQSPKYSTSSASLRKPLDSIVEGVELPQSSTQAGGIKPPISQQQNQKKVLKPSASTKEQGSRKMAPGGGCSSMGDKNQQQKQYQNHHRSSHDGLSVNTTKMPMDSKGKDKRAQRTHSMEGGRKKRNESRGGGGSGSSSAAGCFAMWLSSKFRKGGNGESTESSSSTTTMTGTAEEDTANNNNQQKDKAQ